jgi:amino acid adenylation domain-containing protein
MTAQRRFRLSSAQEQLWFLNELLPGGTAYNVTTASRLRGPVDLAALRGALTAAVARHEMLRVTFGTADGVPYQVAAPAGEAELTVRDLPGADDAAVDEAVSREATTPMDLERGPLYRFTFFRISPDDGVLSATFHHIAVDGWSVNLVNEEISRAYAATAGGGDGGGASYLEIAERGARDEEAVAAELDFWAERLAGLPVLELPADRPRPAERSSRGGVVVRRFPAGVSGPVRELARELGVPVFVPLVAAVQAVLGRYTGQQDVPVGVTMFGREEPEWERVVGLFVNMVVLRGDLSGDPTLGDLAERAGEGLFEAFEHAAVPFEKVVERMAPRRDPGRNPLFQVAVQLLGEENSGGGLALAGVAAEPVRGVTGGSRFDLTVTFVSSGDGLRADIEYSADLFDRWRVEAMAEHVERVLAQMASDPGRRLAQADLLTGPEREQLLAFGRGPASSREQRPVHGVVSDIAAAQPGLLAASFLGQELTYGELDRRAGLLARYLQSLGVAHEQVVAVGLERGLDFLVALLGVLKAGAAYTVIDPAQPASRLEHILADSGAPVLLIGRDAAAAAPRVPGCRVVSLDDVPAGAGGLPLEERATRDSLVYVLYTSGSTGKPKGVLLEHRALMSFAESYRDLFRFGPGDRLLQTRPVTFDMTHGEIICALTCGAALILAPEDTVMAPEALAALIAAEKPTYVGLPTTLLALVDAGPYPSVRAVMNGGESVPADVVNKWNLPGRQFVNAYGPTETAVVCTAHECEHRDWDAPPPIGRPCLDRQLYVTDPAGQLVPVGIPGELLIGGTEGLARGYRNLPDLTTERFTPDPRDPAARVYRSGDIVRWTPAGELEFLGRADTQVKLRGYRIELGDIEAALTAHPAVAVAAVALRSDHGTDQLVAYHTTTAGHQPPAPAQLRDHVAGHLPAYMIPTAWQHLDSFPLTASGKIDRNALPAPQAAAADEAADFVAAAAGTEAAVAEVLAEVLGIERVSASHTFFDLGGNSLQAMRVVSRLNRAFGVKVNVRLLYGGASISTVAAQIDELVTGAAGRGAG